MPEGQVRPNLQTPEAWRRDLYPHSSVAGQNQGAPDSHPELAAPTAYDVKRLHDTLRDFSDDDLKAIPVLPRGSRFEQGATYIDLADPNRREFTALGAMEAGERNCYVPKKAVDYQLWNRLIGVQNPERLGQADERS